MYIQSHVLHPCRHDNNNYLHYLCSFICMYIHKLCTAGMIEIEAIVLIADEAILSL